MAGRKTKPTAIKKLEGNPGKRKLNTKEPIPAKGMPECPEWLMPEAKKEWERLANLMNQMGVLTEVDMAAFAAYCQSYARWKEAQEHITSEGSAFETDKGYQQQTPWVGMKQTIVTIALVTAALDPVLIIIGKVISAVGTIMTIVPKVAGVIKTVQGAFVALNATMLANPIVLIIAAIAALVAAFIYLWNTNEEFRQFWIDLWEDIKEIAVAVWKGLKEFFSAVWEAIRATAETVFSTVRQTEMYVEGFKAKLKKDTSYKGLWVINFTLKEL